jgi:hypothetical protein
MDPFAGLSLCRGDRVRGRAIQATCRLTLGYGRGSRCREDCLPSSLGEFRAARFGAELGGLWGWPGGCLRMACASQTEMGLRGRWAGACLFMPRVLACSCRSGACLLTLACLP